MSGVRPTTSPTKYLCYTGYCEFVRCIRRINANNLVIFYTIIDEFNLTLNIVWWLCYLFDFCCIAFSIKQIDNCLLENIARNLTSQTERVNFYSNITSCVLARSRCNAYNPITGIIYNF